MSVSLRGRVRNRIARIAPGRPVRDDRVPALQQQVDQLSKQVRRLNRRIAQLEEELLDARSQGRRVAELSDVVTELLVHEASRRDPEFQRILDEFARERRG